MSEKNSTGSANHMVSLKFEEFTADEQLKALAEAADGIWHECFPGIISEGQIDYMVEKFQSFDAMKRQIAEEGYHYFAVMIDEVIAGYYAVAKQAAGELYGDSLYLSKLYLRADMRRKGLASMMFREVKKYARREGCELIWLTVNRGNAHAIEVYKHFGMTLLREQKADIGGGYYMDDYVYGIMV